VMWEDGKIRRLTDRYGRATSINSHGQVAGCLATSSQCFVWSRDDLTVFGPDEAPLAPQAGIDRRDRCSIVLQLEGIDRQGRVVGWTGDAAFVWSRGGVRVASRPHHPAVISKGHQ
jgi:hypothetical protein